VVDAAVHTWGYQYLKLDFLYAGALLGFRHDLTKTGAQALRHALERIRKAAGDKVFLAGCGCPLGSGLGVFDAMRIGPDVALGWRPEFHGIEPFFTGETNMPSVRNAIRNIIARAPLHGLWWINDPDCIILQGPSIGKGPSYDGELSAAALPSRLNQIERQSLWTAVALSGGSMMDSDALPELEKADWEQLGRMIPPLPGRPLVPDWFVSSPARLMAMRMESGLGEWMLLAVFNLTDKKQDCSVNMASLWGRAVAGWHSFEAWSGVYAGIGSDGHLNAGYIAPHGVRLYALREHDGRPMWLGDQLHISQGLVVEEWRVDRDVVVARLAPGFPRRGAAWIWLPGELASARISGRPINFHGGPHLYRLDLDLQGPSDLSLALK
jgi:alpha-galactosidase